MKEGLTSCTIFLILNQVFVHLITEFFLKDKNSWILSSQNLIQLDPKTDHYLLKHIKKLPLHVKASNCNHKAFDILTCVI